MANPGAFAAGFTSGFNLVDSAFARRQQAERQARNDLENQRRFDIQNTRAEAVEGRLSTAFDQQQALIAEQQSADQLAQAYARGDMDGVLNNPAVVSSIRARIEDGTNTTFAGFQTNDDGTITPLVDGEGFQSRPVTHDGVPIAEGGQPISMRPEELLDMGFAAMPNSQQGRAAITGMTAERMRGAQQATAPAGTPTVEEPAEPLQAGVEPTGPPGNFVQQAAINPVQQAGAEPTGPAGNLVQQAATNPATDTTVRPGQTFVKTDGKPSAELPPRISTEINSIAREFPNIPPSALAHLIAQESNFDPTAVSKAGATGLAQLMKPTAGELGVTDRTDIRQSLRGGAEYLSQQYDRFGNWEQALAAYNAGPARTQRAINEHGDAWLENLRQETQDYVALLAPSFNAAASAADEGVQLASANPGEVAQTAAQNVDAVSSASPTVTWSDVFQREMQHMNETFGDAPNLNGLFSGDVEWNSTNVGRAYGELIAGVFNIGGTVATTGTPQRNTALKAIGKFGAAVWDGVRGKAAAVKESAADFGVGVMQGVAAGDPEYIPTYLKASGSNKAQNARSDMATESIKGSSAPAGTPASEQVMADTLNTPITGQASPAKAGSSWQTFNRQLDSGRRNIPRPVYGLMPQMIQLGIFTQEDVAELYRTGTMTDPRTRKIIEGLNSVEPGETYYMSDGQGGVTGVTKPGVVTTKQLREAEQYRQQIRDRNEGILKRSFMAYYPGEDSEENAERLLNKLATDMIRSERFSWEELNAMDEEQLIRFGQNYLHADTTARVAADPGFLGKVGNLLGTSAGWLRNLPPPKEDPTYYGPDGLWMIHEDVVSGDVPGVPSQPTQIEDGILTEARKVKPHEVPGLRDQLIASGDPALVDVGKTGADYEVAVNWAAWQMGARKRSLPAQPGRR